MEPRNYLKPPKRNTWSNLEGFGLRCLCCRMHDHDKQTYFRASLSAKGESINKTGHVRKLYRVYRFGV